MFGVWALWKAQVTKNNLTESRRHKRGWWEAHEESTASPWQGSFLIHRKCLAKFAPELTKQISGQEHSVLLLDLHFRWWITCICSQLFFLTINTTINTKTCFKNIFFYKWASSVINTKKHFITILRHAWLKKGDCEAKSRGYSAQNSVYAAVLSYPKRIIAYSLTLKHAQICPILLNLPPMEYKQWNPGCSINLLPLFACSWTYKHSVFMQLCVPAILLCTPKPFL